jgi:hypothetical protein
MYILWRRNTKLKQDENMTTLKQSINDDRNVWRELDQKLEAENSADDQAERFNHLCLDTVKAYVNEGKDQHTAKDLIWEALSESFDQKDLGTAGVDLIIKGALNSELDGAGTLEQQAEVGRILIQGIINYDLRQAAEDVAVDLNLCSCEIEPEQYIIEEA